MLFKGMRQFRMMEWDSVIDSHRVRFMDKLHKPHEFG